MANPRFIEIDGKRYLWRELLARRKEQIRALAEVSQPVLSQSCDFGRNQKIVDSKINNLRDQIFGFSEICDRTRNRASARDERTS